MRPPVDRDRIERFMDALRGAAEVEGRVYFTGGATAVLEGWRDATIVVDIKLDPDQDSVLRAIPAIKESLGVNVELAAPSDFIPVSVGWDERSPSVGRRGKLAFHHFDPVAQALAKAERGHRTDLIDIREILKRGMATPEAMRRELEAIGGELHRYPAIDPAQFRAAVERVLG